ncbi:MAG: 2-oxo acid dehydrogenase subunit E2, partial [Cellulomonas sp.]
LAWWASSLAVAATGAAVVVLGTGGAPGRTPTLVATLLAATLGVCALAGAAARAAPAPSSPLPARAADTAPPAGPEPAAVP